MQDIMPSGARFSYAFWPKPTNSLVALGHLLAFVPAAWITARDYIGTGATHAEALLVFNVSSPLFLKMIPTNFVGQHVSIVQAKID